MTGSPLHPAALAALLLLPFALAFGAEPAPDFSAWTIDGYRIGMGRPEALEIRKAVIPTADIWDVKIKKYLKGRLRFDGDGLYLWRARRLNVTEPWLIVYDFTDRFGDPAFDLVEAEPHPEEDFLDKPKKRDKHPDREIGWHSAACDTGIYIKQEYFAPADRLVVQVFMARLSKLEHAIGGPVEKVPRWLEDD